jgi:hypothetical protein
MANESRNKKNMPPPGEGKKHSLKADREDELEKRSEVMQAQHGRAELNIGTGEDREPAERTGEARSGKRTKVGR